MSRLTPNASFSRRLELKINGGAAAEGALFAALTENNCRLVSWETCDGQASSKVLVFDAPAELEAGSFEQQLSAVEGVELLSSIDLTFELHEGGKLETVSRTRMEGQRELSMAYTPGVARVCRAVAEDPQAAYRYTIKKNTVAIVTDGTAVLGLGDIGPLGALPVMEGKAVLFKEFGGVDAFPVCLDTCDPQQIIETVVRLAPAFGGINLEDISAPRCFEIEAELNRLLDIPVFHDDQHGTAIVTLAALFNAAKLTGRTLAGIKAVINGAGAAGITVARLLRRAGVKDIVICDSKGIISSDRSGLHSGKQEFAVEQSGTLADALPGSDLFVGVSVPGVLTREMVETMAPEPVLFAMSNPIPEIQPEAVQDIAGVIATGRSDYPNQINNVLAFPGIFRGALDCRAAAITPEMHIAAARAISGLVTAQQLSPQYVIPSVFDPGVAAAVADAVKAVAEQD